MFENAKKVGGGALATLALTGGLWASQPQTFDTIAEIQNAQATYYQNTGKYLQVLPNNKNPHYEQGTTQSKLGKKLPPNTRVDVYETPKGEKGYQLTYEDAAVLYTIGDGPEAKVRNRIVDKPLPAVPQPATTTLSFQFPDLMGMLLRFTAQTAYAFTSNSHATDLERSSSQYWSITDASQTGLDFSDTLTLAGWFKFESLSETPIPRYQLITKAESSGNYSYVWSLSTDAPQNLSMSIYSNGTTRVLLKLFNTSLSTGTWYHLAVTKTGTTLTMYVDGSPISLSTTVTNTSGTIFNSTSAFIIGGGFDTSSDSKTDGLIDDVRVWSRVLSDAEITDLYTNPCTFTDGANLQGAWRFDNNGLDETANNNDLTNNNTATFTTSAAYTCPVTATQADDTYFEIIE